MRKKLEIGQTYVTTSGHIRKLVRIETGIAYFENLSKDADDGWFYEEDGTYALIADFQEKKLNSGWLKVYEG